MGDKMFRLKTALQHRLNPLHVYCRLIPIVGEPRAMAFVCRYEGFYKRILLKH